jgi:epoxyqueuosine reductase
LAITASRIKQLAFECGFELVGITAAVPSEDFARFDSWRSAGCAGEMAYLTDRRGDLRADPKNLLAAAKSMVCVGKLYNTADPYSTDQTGTKNGWISRYAWGADYHDVLRDALTRLIGKIAGEHDQPFDYRICVDTAPLLERSYARQAGLGWIGRNTCLINQASGSWFFLGELLLSIPLAADSPAPNRCGTCTRCIEACPTAAIVPDETGQWQIDARLCISYLTIEKRGAIAPQIASQTRNHLFGCDICQDVCPWNGRAPLTAEPAFSPAEFSPALERFASFSEQDFRDAFRNSPVWRAKYSGFLRNVAWAMGNSGNAALLEPLSQLIYHSDPLVAASATQARQHLEQEVRGCEHSACVASR